MVTDILSGLLFEFDQPDESGNQLGMTMTVIAEIFFPQILESYI